ncbi:MAG TPA: fused response regulator/phosphatase [Pseudonocardiaceae bacterium]|jgi:CheY-like chemotaxis protein
MSPHIPPLNAPDKPARILVVDDSEASRYITASWLRRHGHDVTEATDGTTALTLVDQGQFELVVLDVNLPDMSGFEVCEHIKGTPGTAALPVVHVSATYVGASDRARGLTRGADAYLSEPVDPDELIATVTAALRYYRARAAAERLAARLRQLTGTSLAANTASSFPELVEAVATGAAALFGGTAFVSIALADGREQRALLGPDDLLASVQERESGLVGRLATLALGSSPGARVVELAAGDWPGQGPAFAVLSRAKTDQPACCVAVPDAAITLPEDRDLLTQLGQAAAVAAQGLRAYTAEHTLALTLQRSLLPSSLPERPDLTMAADYIPATDEAEVGGDFYEVTELDENRVLVAIGDVTGHSITSATVMGEVLHALRAYALEGHHPTGILSRLDTMLQRFHPGGYTTVCLMLIDSAAGTVEIANAGHLPPLFIDDDGARYISLSGPLLGMGLAHPAATMLPLPVDTTIVLMTDGLVERPGVSITEDLERLRLTMSVTESPEEICRRLLVQFGQNKDDDIAVLAVRRG